MGFWEVQLGGKWKSLGRVVGTACNEARDRGATQLKFVSHGQEYLIDFKLMTQQNVNSGKTRPVRNKSAHRHSDAIHVHPGAPTPSAPPMPAPPVPPAPKTEKKSSSFLGRWLGRAAGATAVTGAAAAAGAGLMVVGGVCDLGDITDAAAAAGDVLQDMADDAADAAAEAADAAAGAAGDAHAAVVDLAAGGADAAVELF